PAPATAAPLAADTAAPPTGAALPSPAGTSTVSPPGASPQAAVSAAPGAVIRLRFADALTLERAGALFAAGVHPGLGEAWGDRAALTLHIAGDAGIETLRGVLAALDAAALTAESLTVHTNELDDVWAAFTALP
ncbi:hypothetical protein ABZS63_17780, partial [Streptomyces sp. NPDC005568]